MPKFSKTSQSKLDTCDKRLQLLFSVVVQRYDCTVLEGQRSAAKQNAAFKAGKSKLKYPKSKHNKKPSLAVDVAPYDNRKVDFSASQCYHFVGYVKAVADTLGIPIRCGADWDNDNDVNDQTFNDLVHFELKV